MVALAGYVSTSVLFCCGLVSMGDKHLVYWLHQLGGVPVVLVCGSKRRSTEGRHLRVDSLASWMKELLNYICISAAIRTSSCNWNVNKGHVSLLTLPNLANESSQCLVAVLMSWLTR
jgi:hypothetical protein